MQDKQLSATTMGLHLYFNCEHADVEPRNSIADNCGPVRKKIERVLAGLYRNIRDSPDPTKGLPQFLRACMLDGTGYLGLLLDSVSGFSGGGTPNKRRRLNGNATGRRDIKECSDADAERINMRLLEAFVDHAWPFTAFDKKEGKFYDAILELRPGYATSHYPCRSAITGRYLGTYFSRTEEKVQTAVCSGLRRGYGTLIFDGWDDNTGASVVNLLLRIDGGTDNTRKIVFLDSVFTGTNRMHSSAYVRLIEQVMSRFGGLARICAVTSDSASSCVNAKNTIMNAYPHVVSVSDQAHIADLLMKDVGKLTWVKAILDKVAAISRDTRGKRKLLARLREKIDATNMAIPPSPLVNTTEVFGVHVE